MVLLIDDDKDDCDIFCDAAEIVLSIGNQYGKMFHCFPFYQR